MFPLKNPPKKSTQTFSPPLFKYFEWKNEMKNFQQMQQQTTKRTEQKDEKNAKKNME